MAEHRSETRQRSLLRGRIEFDHGRSTVECIVREVSDGGAKLDVSPAVAIPDAFELYIPHKDHRFRVQAKWRTGRFVGVQFVLPEAKPGPSASNTPDMVRHLADQNRVLKRQIAELEADHLARRPRAA